MEEEDGEGSLLVVVSSPDFLAWVGSVEVQMIARAAERRIICSFILEIVGMNDFCYYLISLVWMIYVPFLSSFRDDLHLISI